MYAIRSYYERTRGVRTLTPEELMRKDVSLGYVSKLLSRKFTNAQMMRSVLQTIMYQVESGHEVFVVGSVQDDGTVKGGTGWGAEFAKLVITSYSIHYTKLYEKS